MLQEWIPAFTGPAFLKHPQEGRYTGNSLVRWITSITDGDVQGLWSGYVVLGLGEEMHERAVERHQQAHTALSQDDLRRIENDVRGNTGGPRQRAHDVAVDETIPDNVYWSERDQNFYRWPSGTPVDGADHDLWWPDRGHFPTKLTLDQRASSRQLSEMAEQGPESVRDRGLEAVDPIDEAFIEPNQKVSDGRLPAPGEDRVSPLTAHERELVGILAEECAEVIIQISKLKRFGRVGIDKIAADHHQKYDNIALLGMEMGHVQHMINVIMACELVWPSSVEAGAHQKAEKLMRYLQTRPST